MRCLVIDTETTGLDPKQGHRIIEIGVIELSHRRPTDRHLHFYLNPDREIDAGATEVHGMTWDDLKDKPRFADVAAELAEFARDADWIIHNAPFDIAFLDAEFSRVGLPVCANLHKTLVDTLALARETFPGKRNNLDALCERFGVSNAQRTLHGALLDAGLLADVYLAMTRGQETLMMDIAAPPLPGGTGATGATAVGAGSRPTLRVVMPSADELLAHQAYLEALDRDSKGRCLWLGLEREQAA
jgi:DNA polymerase III subunit epsilon